MSIAEPQAPSPRRGQAPRCFSQSGVGPSHLDALSWLGCPSVFGALLLPRLVFRRSPSGRNVHWHAPKPHRDAVRQGRANRWGRIRRASRQNQASEAGKHGCDGGQSHGRTLLPESRLEQGQNVIRLPALPWHRLPGPLQPAKLRLTSGLLKVTARPSRNSAHIARVPRGEHGRRTNTSAALAQHASR